jgi:hypothetical protein
LDKPVRQGRAKKIIAYFARKYAIIKV